MKYRIYQLIILLYLVPINAEERHIFLLVGQSNMAGRAQIEPRDAEPINGVSLWNIERKEWELATPPYNRYSLARKPMNMQRLNIGPSFAEAYLKRNPGVEVGIVCAARGGTSTFQWDKDNPDQYDLYNRAVEATKAALATGGELKGILWHQGESDVGGGKLEGYLDRLNQIVTNFRTDLGAEKTPFVCGQIGQWNENNAAFNETIRKVNQTITNSACASSAGLKPFDSAHFDSASMREFGRRYEAALASLVPRKLKDLNGFFPFHVPGTLSGWEDRAALLKRRVLVANGLYPLPERTPLNTVVHGKFERPDFTVEKVYFESVPGLHVTGLLFRPANAKPGQKFPAVLSPHGHGGRLQDHGAAGVKKQIEIGGEKFADSGRFPKVARCGNLARLGCVVFLYDMIGYADNQQLSRQVGHGLKLRRPDMAEKEDWGFYSAQAEMRLQSIFGVQTWNSIRGIDFLQSLPDVDPNRIAVTGGSGGGTQTIMVCAIDDRPIAAFPNGMVSSSMQGGCTCENASLLRIGTGNVELTALFAPKPQGMTAADDWTREMFVPGKGYPELKKLYSLYGKPENVFCGNLLRFKHNYNVLTREWMYHWFNRHLDLGHKGIIAEKDFKALTKEEHAVYNELHPRPEGGPEFERELNQWLADQSDSQIGPMPTEKRHELVITAWQTIIGIDDPVFPSPAPAAEEGVVTIEIKGDPDQPAETEVVANPRQIPAYTHGYNHSYFAKRVRDLYSQILDAEAAGHQVSLVAAPGEEAVALAAAVISDKGMVSSINLGDDSFRFNNITDWRDPYFIPGAVKYGDVPNLIEAVKSLGTQIQK